MRGPTRVYVRHVPYEVHVQVLYTGARKYGYTLYILTEVGHVEYERWGLLTLTPITWIDSQYACMYLSYVLYMYTCTCSIRSTCIHVHLSYQEYML